MPFPFKDKALLLDAHNDIRATKALLILMVSKLRMNRKQCLLMASEMKKPMAPASSFLTARGSYQGSTARLDFLCFF